MQECAERRLHRRLLDHRDFAVADRHAVDTERGPRMRELCARYHLEARGNRAERRMTGVAVQTRDDPPNIGHCLFREGAPRLHEIVLRLIRGINHSVPALLPSHFGTAIG